MLSNSTRLQTIINTPGLFPYTGWVFFALPRIVSSIQMLGTRIFSFKNSEQIKNIANNPFLYSSAKIVSFIDDERYNKTTNSLDRKAHSNNKNKPWGMWLQGSVVARGYGHKWVEQLRGRMFARGRFLFMGGLVGGMACRGGSKRVSHAVSCGLWSLDRKKSQSHLEVLVLS